MDTTFLLLSAVLICGGIILLGILAAIGLLVWRRSRQGSSPVSSPSSPPYVEPVTQSEDEPEPAPLPTRVAAVPPMRDEVLTPGRDEGQPETQDDAQPIIRDEAPALRQDEPPTEIDLQPPPEIVDTLWRLVVATGTEVGRSYPLQGQVRVGREADNDIVLTGDQRASRHHALFQLKENSLEVFDLNSSNGIYVDDKKIKGTSRLHSGNLVKIGKTVFVVQYEG